MSIRAWGGKLEILAFRQKEQEEAAEKAMEEGKEEVAGGTLVSSPNETQAAHQRPAEESLSQGANNANNFEDSIESKGIDESDRSQSQLLSVVEPNNNEKRSLVEQNDVVDNDEEDDYEDAKPPAKKLKSDDGDVEPMEQFNDEEVQQQTYQHQLQQVSDLVNCSQNELLWMKRFRELVEYIQAHGDAQVPATYKPNKSLAQWVKTQRKQYASYQTFPTNSSMTLERIRRLESVGFVWKVVSRTNSNNKTSASLNPQVVAAAMAAPHALPQAPHAGLKTPPEYAAVASAARLKAPPDSTAAAEPSMGNPKVSPTSASRLSPGRALGASDEAWMQRYQELVAYHQANGDCLVPKGWKANPALANWVKTQRKLFRLYQDNEPTSITAERIELLDKLDFQWKVREASSATQQGWMERYRELVNYYESYGDCMVPQNFKLNPSLGTWVHTQRREYKRYLEEQNSSYLTPHRVELLENINFQWKVHDDWSERFQDLEEYRKAHGHCLVPRNYPADPSLGRWVRTQRKEYNRMKEGKASAMTKGRADLLEKVGFVWKMRDTGSSSWQDSFEELEEYSKAHDGDCNVPRIYNGGQRLHNWVKTQRKEYKRLKDGDLSGSMNPQRIAMLELIGFQWSVRPRDDWMVRFEQLKAYAHEKGDCLVPKAYAINPSLGNWVATQRKEFKKLKEGQRSYLTAERAQLLQDIGFSWKVHQDGGWMARFNELKEYHAKNGNCDVPKNYPPNQSLANWVRTQRRDYKARDGEKKANSSLTDDRIKMLEELGFQWQMRCMEDWMTRYSELRAYKEKHGDCLVPQRYPENPNLGAWVNEQRQQYKHYKKQQEPKADGSAESESLKNVNMTEEKIQLLDALDFEWAPKEARWMMRYRQLEAWMKEHGSVPTYEQNRSLKQWVDDVKKMYRNAYEWGDLTPPDPKVVKLSLERKLLLDRISFPFPVLLQEDSSEQQQQEGGLNQEPSESQQVLLDSVVTAAESALAQEQHQHSPHFLPYPHPEESENVTSHL